MGMSKDKKNRPNIKMKSLEPKVVSKCPFTSVWLRNVSDDHTFQDTLHHKAVKNMACRTGVCNGSVMFPKALMSPPDSRPTPDASDRLVQALDFINQFYKPFTSSRIEDYLARLEQVSLEIDATGTYQLTSEELAFAAKQAWRNAPRCIGRIQWSNLQVFDARRCSTAKEMFDNLCEHLHYASNGGNLRSAITIFPQRTDGKHDFRVWNRQLIKYAGYQMPDGTIRGDPGSLDFTEICIRLGWTPKYGPFDVLPLVLQANGEDPEVFEIPPELILEVSMEHPQFDWFKDMQLKWYALPAVSNMMLEVGGLQFTACPFNGWFMGTEIGVRDFCDPQRYNILEQVGRKMGLETQTLSSLWKDEALLAVNVAVIYSFQKNKVTITDHHSASESFMKHMENEVRLRGGCPADWIWLVPPMSGSLTAVFHQEMASYILSPFYYYQPEPWETHVWKDKKKLKKKEIHFKAAARAVLFTVSLMRPAMALRVRCTVLYATETGKSLTLARKLNSMLNCAFNSRFLCMEDYVLSDLETECLLIVVTSTFGNGDPPGNGESFKKGLLNLESIKNKFRYCVFGLGSRMYPQFCAFAHTLDTRLAQLGARSLLPVGEGDELNAQEESFTAWAQAAFQEACKEFKIHGQLSVLKPPSDIWEHHRYRVQNENCPLDRMRALSETHSKALISMKLKRKVHLQSTRSSRSTILVELEKDSGAEPLRYAPGDHVGVFPGNPAELVAGVLKHLSDATPINQSVRLESLYTSGSGITCWETDGRIPACPLPQALTYLLDISSPPSQNLLHKLSQIATQEDQKRHLLMLATDYQEYMKWTNSFRPTFLEVLQQFPSVELTATFLLSQLPLLKPRLYSVSSSPELCPNELHLTVTVLNYHTQDGHGPLHHGVCSTWLNTIKEGDLVPCFLHSSEGFHLTDPSIPVILVGVGSGIAPFRSFWQQRIYDQEQKGLASVPMTLVFGCRSADTDHLYREEVQEMKRKGVFRTVMTAYSREPSQDKTYVQDILRDSLAEEVAQVLHQQAGHIYVCGSISMSRDVAHTIEGILAHRLGISALQASQQLAQIKSEKRYHEDIFGDKTTGVTRMSSLGGQQKMGAKSITTSF
ncbi:nitric oxide synthase 2b, inducible [Alosa alosa]|uniref:nitric oxide synthase 2b, inducible n=1 Tax=Alosa alosa TaxID=278164 RepID=UPI0020152977|nr:nitric oxide synthase 2b, inducible [Alosa alosa]